MSGNLDVIRKMSAAKALALERGGGGGTERGISDSQNMKLEQAKGETINIDKKVSWKWETLVSALHFMCNRITMTPRRIKTTYCPRLR